MKVYVDCDMPKSCKDCFFCEHIEEDIDGKGRDEVACYFEGCLNNILLGDTFSAKTCKHLQSLSDYTKQVRRKTVKEVLDFIEEHKAYYFEQRDYYGAEYIFFNRSNLEKDILDKISTTEKI